MNDFQKNPNRGLHPRRRKGPGRRRHPECRDTRAYTDANACFLRVRKIPASSTARVVVLVTPLLAQLPGRQKRHVPEKLLSLVWEARFGATTRGGRGRRRRRRRGRINSNSTRYISKASSFIFTPDACHTCASSRARPSATRNRAPRFAYKHSRACAAHVLACVARARALTNTYA